MNRWPWPGLLLCLAGCSPPAPEPVVLERTRPLAAPSKRSESAYQYAPSASRKERAVPTPSKPQLLAWRLGTVDPRFQLSSDEAEAQIRAAAAVWENAAGRKLFVKDEVSGFPIDWVFDHRQERIDGMSAERTKLGRIDEEIKATREEIESGKSETDRKFRDMQARRELLEAKYSGFNARVAEWNAHGGAPDGVRDQLEQDRKAMEEERSALNAEVDALNEEQRQMQHRVDDLNAKVLSRNQLMLSLKLTEGEFFEQVGVCKLRGKTVDGINIFAFASHEALRRTLTHELGHALHLKHVGGSGSVMNAAAQGPAAERIILSRQDRSELRRALAKP